MGMVIHDDFWAACQAMPEKQRAPFLYAIALYRFEKKEPKGSPPWLPTFIAFRDRLDMADEASERGRKMARARWGKRKAQADAEHDAQARSQHDAQAYTQAYTQAYAQASNSTDAENEIEIGGEPPYSPPADFDAEPAGDFPSLCLAALAEATGQAYTTMPARCRRELERCSGRFDAAQVRGMIEFKRDEWRAEDAAKGTRFSRNLTPNTLFSPDHFEQYMGQLLAHREEVGRYAEYD